MKAIRLFLIVGCIVWTSVAFGQQSGRVNVPTWAKDAVWYQIFPERFANGDSTNDPPGTEPWGGVPKRDNYFGGDLQGIINRLDYLQDLGINAIYLNPILESQTNHKYHTTNYYTIDDNFGTNKTFKTLVDECHRRGMRIIIDGVFNHTGVDFFAFQDIKRNEECSRFLKWYNVHSFPVQPPEKPNYEAWWGLGDLPKLMTNNPEVRNYLFDVTKFWMRFGIDGWRLDVPNEMSHDFWIEWRKLVKEANPDAYIVGEIWEDASRWLQGDQFDAVMNYLFRNACIGFFARADLKPSQFDSLLNHVRGLYVENVNQAMQNLVGSHDTERYLTLCGGDVSKAKLTALFQMTYVGAPMIYYGDEIGMEGLRDPDCRRTMVWDTTRWNKDLRSHYKKLIKIRRDHRVFREGTFSAVHVDDVANTYGFLRSLGTEQALVVVNNSASQLSFGVVSSKISDGKWRDLLTGKTYSSVKGRVPKINMSPRSGVILIKQG